MTHLDHLSSWVEAHRKDLETAGEVKFQLGPSDRPNPGASLALESHHKSVDLLLWESGEAEFNRRVEGELVFEHVEVERPADLDALLERVGLVIWGKT